ncbi:ABC transporter ATP-binding protein [Bacillus sp. FJAT-50079]|uniref:ABC transporter ATP-binding protein n=1 Tax=Bacillus sp. FJAT-50079 TaxID=2833577 RepID=UPI001BCA1D00|nr:ABC transporter ATP-binding protein [Bacillus sp. FJAT-50079]MBS4206521.1 ABC transporter ATP-binding protein [Bacillus sp. FJAT-50079]
MLNVEGVTSGYGKVTIIRDINIKVEKGEIVSIIGRNGVGKSTFIKSIIGLLKSNAGKIVFDNQDITKLDSFERARLGIGYIPQGHGIFPKLTVEENLKMGEQINIRAQNEDYDVIYHYFPRLKERLKQRAGTLSGGEQAQLAIGRALIGKPMLLLLDEPSEGIQPNIISMIRDIIHQINRELGLTVLFVEQHIGLILKMSDRCYAIDKGSIIGEHKGKEISPEMIKKYLSV